MMNDVNAGRKTADCGMLGMMPSRAEINYTLPVLIKRETQRRPTVINHSWRAIIIIDDSYYFITSPKHTVQT